MTGIRAAPSDFLNLGVIPKVSNYLLTSSDTLSMEFIALIVITLPVLPYVSITGAVYSLKTFILFLIVS